MALDLVAITIRSPTRIRLSFSQTLAAGAFNPAPYEVTNLDAKGVDPTVRAALAVPNSPHVVEIVLSDTLASDALYEVACTLVPDTEPATFSGTMDFRTSAPPAPPSASVATDDMERLLYGADLVWNGRDLVEAANGDLARVEGLANVNAALLRLVEADGLPWEANYGGKARASVDAPSTSQRSLRGNLVRGVLRDDRTKEATVTLNLDDNSGTPEVTLDVKLIGNRQLSLTNDTKVGA